MAAVNPPAARALVLLLLMLLAPPARGIDLQLLAECAFPSPYVFCTWGEPMLSPDGTCVAFTDGATRPQGWDLIAYLGEAGTYVKRRF